MNTFMHTFTHMISGTSGCGKTSFCVRLLANLGKQCTESDFRDIMWCFSEGSAVPRGQLAGNGRRIVYNKGIPYLENTNDGP